MIPLVAPHYEEPELRAAADVVTAGSVDGGAVTLQFERAVADQIGGVHGQGTPSGTAALHLALVAAGVGRGDEVITPSYTCVAVLNAIHLVGAIPVLVDNLDDPSQLEFNLDTEQALTSRSTRTRAIIVPHAFGVTADVGSLLDDRGIAVIEDCAMALGSARGATAAGSLGRFATFSFHPTKVISTGAGGMVVARDADAAEALRRANSYLDTQRAQRTVPLHALSGSYSYSCGYQLTDPQAALGLAQLARLPSRLRRRHEIAEWYSKELATTEAIFPTDLHPGGFPFRFQLDLSAVPTTPVEAITALAARGVEGGRGVYPALHQLLGLDPERFPRASRCTAHLLSLPVHPALSDLDVELVTEACRDALTARP
jgi:dTDP-4-amino-4,6-dideoxygalactose transaminase